MQTTESIYIPSEIVSQAQIEGATCIRALTGLMDDMRTINKYSRIPPYIERFYRIHKKIHPRVMLIFAGMVDFDNPEQREEFLSYQNELLQERRELAKMVALIRSTRLSATWITAYNERDWCNRVYMIADELFEDWVL